MTDMSCEFLSKHVCKCGHETLYCTNGRNLNFSDHGCAEEKKENCKFWKEHQEFQQYLKELDSKLGIKK